MNLLNDEHRLIKLIHIGGLLAIKDLMAINAEVMLEEGKQQGASEAQIEQVKKMSELYQTKLMARIALRQTEPDSII